MADVVLDASALLALLNAEPGADFVAGFLPRSAISAVNLSEVIAKLTESGMPEIVIQATLKDLTLEVVRFDETQAILAGVLRTSTRRYGLSLGDRCCLGLAQALSLPVLTADQIWNDISVGVEITVIR